MSSREVFDVKARLISIDKAQGNVYKAILHAPEIAAEAKPMQFVNVMVREEGAPLLRRPFGLSAIDSETGAIEITWAVVGLGTRIMSEWTPGQTVNVLGPLGNGMDMSKLECRSNLVLIAGGTGLAPLLPLASIARKKGTDVLLFYGVKSASQLMDTACLRNKGCQVFLATEDGSEGVKGLATDLLKEHLLPLGQSHCRAEDTAAIACGPKPMLKQVKQIFRKVGAPLFISLEERMACGYGLCQGCAARASGASKEGYYHVCTDGPVFLADNVDLESE